MYVHQSQVCVCVCVCVWARVNEYMNKIRGGSGAQIHFTLYVLKVSLETGVGPP